ncbi:MAG: beta-propeller fold lactonase family protein [Chloroflexi bacterium]|nr:beta-propeller fold lactonase family protein [Chloroflexota bacterium]
MSRHTFIQKCSLLTAASASSAKVVLLILSLFILFQRHASPAQAVALPITVNTTNVVDNPNDGSCDLFEALQAAFSQKSSGGSSSYTYHECTAEAGPKFVVFSGTAASGTIILPTGAGSLDLPFINDNVTITGPVILDGDGERILTVAASGDLSLANLTLQNGDTAGGGGAILSNGGGINLLGVSVIGNTADNDGGAINTSGSLNILASNFSGNSAGRNGGAIYQSTSSKGMQIAVSNFSGNTSEKSAGAIYIKSDDVEISDTIFSGNVMHDDNPDNNTRGGGALFLNNNAELSLIRSVFNGNLSLNGHGGAIYMNINSELAIRDNSFNGNIAGEPTTAQLGGAIYSQETLTISGATFLNNLAAKGDGGAIFNDKGGTLDVSNATFTANGALDGNGGAIYNGNTQQGSTIASHATLRNVTLYANLALNDGSAIFNQTGNHTVSLGNTIVDDASGPTANCNRDLTSLGHNIDRGISCGLNSSGDLPNTDPDLALPAPNGGPLATIFTQMPNVGSLAIDAGDPAICSAAPVNNEDQRNDPRPKDGSGNGTAVCDIGALETDARIPGYGSNPIQPGPIVIGTTVVGVAITNTFTIYESGAAQLDVSNMSIGGTNAAEFTQLQPVTDNFSIANGGSKVTVEIRCMPTAVGNRTATLSLNSNDPDHPNVSYNLICHSQAGPTPGFGSDPIAPGPLDYGQIEMGDSASRDLTIMETGNDTLTFGNAALSGPNPSDFTFNAFPTSINDGGVPVVIPITCTPSDVGLRSAILTMTSNDPAVPTVSWNLVCEGVPPPPPFLDSPGQSIDTMDGLYGVANSPDGRHVYATAFFDDSVLVFDRDVVSGTLTYRSNVTSGSLNGAQITAVSPDGKQVYVASGPGGALTIFNRDITTGTLTLAQTFNSGTIANLLGAYGVTVSPNGRFIYVSSTIQNAVIGFERLLDDTIVYRASNSASGVDLLEARNLTVSPDGKNLYVAADYSYTATTGNLVTYTIDPATGALTHLQTISEGDWVGGPVYFIQLDGLGGAFDVAVSPDGRYVYAVGSLDNAIINFARDPLDGSLRYAGGVWQSSASIDGLTGVSGIVVSPDGSHLFTSAYTDDAVAIFTRNQATGRLSQIQVVEQTLANSPPLLNGARDIDVSPDGSTVHTAAFLDDAVVTLHIANPLPILKALRPASTAAGGNDFTLTVLGGDFVPDAEVLLAGSARPTTYISPSTLEAELSAADIATAGTILVTVQNPAPGGGPSVNSLLFTITAPSENPIPTVEYLLPQSIPADGTSDLQITVIGANFIPTSQVQLNGANRATTYVSDTELQAVLLASDLTGIGTAVITVQNPSSNQSASNLFVSANGGSSNQTSFTLAAPGYNLTPAITRLKPPTIVAHGAASAAYTLVVDGSGFTDKSQGRWNGADRPTLYMSDTQLEITLTALDLAFAGWGDVTVENPTPGGGISNAARFRIFEYAISLPVIIR